MSDDRPQTPEAATLEELRRAREAGARAPDLFVLGHAKCGTTALYRMLDAHPQIFMSDVKEPEFLSRATEHRTKGPGPPGKRLPDTLDDYLALFAPAAPGQLAGEASTEYLRTPATAPRIAALAPGASLIAIFREPVSFLRSLHLQLLQVGVESEPDFERALALEPERREGRRIPRGCSWPPALLYSEHVRYAEQLRAYLDHFPREQLLTLVYDDFRLDNERVMREVLRFLAVDDTLALPAIEANPTLRVRSARGEKLVNSVSVGRGRLAGAVKRGLKMVIPERVRRRALRTALHVVVDNDPPPASEAFAAQLRSRFKQHVVDAGEYLDRDLVRLWGYEDVD
jgi:hypothetical protein